MDKEEVYKKPYDYIDEMYKYPYSLYMKSEEWITMTHLAAEYAKVTRETHVDFMNSMTERQYIQLMEFLLYQYEHGEENKRKFAEMFARLK